MRRVVALLGLAIGVLVVTGSAASAQASVESGWWTSAPVAVAPDAPSDGLVIQGGPDASQPVAFAAVSYTGASDATPSSLKLTKASGSATTPGATLAVCPLTTPSFSPAQGGAAADGPKYDCSTKVTASASADGSTFTFDIGSLVAEGGLAVAVVPTTSTDRVVFQKPNESSFVVSGTTAGESSTSTGSSSDFSGSEASSTPAEATLELPGASAPDLGLPPAGVNAAAGTPTTPPAQSSGGSGSGGQVFQSASATNGTGGGGWKRLRGPLFAVLALAAAGLWFVAGSQDRPLLPEP